MKPYLLGIVTAFACALAGAQEGPRLPDMGSSAESILSPQQAEQIGQKMLRELRGAQAVLDDPLLDEYLGALGYRLVAQSEDPAQKFTFFMVRSDQINAFAAPGGYVGVNAGLVSTAESESELAAVLAHEIAHVTQNHLVRAFERMQHASLPIALAMLGTLIAAQGSSGDAAEAAVIGGAALLQQQQINFTRDNEYEADRIGIHTLAGAGFAPQAMADFFARMGRATRANSGDGAPEFLRTHPVTTTRISEAKNRAAQIVPARPAAGETPRGPSLSLPSRAQSAPTTAATPAPQPLWGPHTPSFLCLRERARVLSHPEPASLVAFYQKQSQAHPDAACWQYGLGLVHTRTGNPGAALKVLKGTLANDPGNTLVVLALAEAEARAGQTAAALKRLDALRGQFPGNAVISTLYGRLLVDQGTTAAARQAIALLRPLADTQWAQPGFQTTLARAYEVSGDSVRAGEAHAEVALLHGRFNDALLQLNNLLKLKELTYYQRARIEARIAQITPMALEQRRLLPDGTEPPS